MDPFDYALGLLAVLFGLALADIANSVHKLVRHGGSVRWDGRVVAATLLVIVIIIRLWFSIWSVRSFGSVLVFPFYLWMFVELMILFLLAANCLPDDPAPDCDLGTFYDGNRRIFWSIFAVFQLSYGLHWVYFVGDGAPLRIWAAVFVPLLLYVLLVFVRARWLQYAVPILVVGFEVMVNWNRSLGG